MSISQEVLDRISAANCAFIKVKSDWEESRKKPGIVQDPDIVLTENQRQVYQLVKGVLEEIVTEMSEGLGIENFELATVYRNRLTKPEYQSEQMRRVVDFEYRFRTSPEPPIQDERFGYRKLIVSLVPEDGVLFIFNVPVPERYLSSDEVITYIPYVRNGIKELLAGETSNTPLKTIQINFGSSGLEKKRGDLTDILKLAILAAERVPPQF